MGPRNYQAQKLSNYQKKIKHLTLTPKCKFCIKTQTVNFTEFFNACHQLQFQKNLINRFRENFKKTDLELKNEPFTPF